MDSRHLDEFEGAMRIIAEESGHQVSHFCVSKAFRTRYNFQAGCFIVHNQHGNNRHADSQERHVQVHVRFCCHVQLL